MRALFLFLSVLYNPRTNMYLCMCVFVYVCVYVCMCLGILVETRYKYSSYNHVQILCAYTFTKRCNVEEFELGKQYKTSGYSTVSFFNLIHLDCHHNALRYVNTLHYNRQTLYKHKKYVYATNIFRLGTNTLNFNAQYSIFSKFNSSNFKKLLLLDQ